MLGRTGLMKKYLWLLFSLALAGTLLLAQAATSRTSDSSIKTSGKSPGLELAQSISLVTGVAISPLLGVSAVGAWQYFSTDKDQRAGLSWYAQPWFWLCGLLLVGGVAAKDTFGVATPPGMKKPLDVLEVFENKVSGLVAAGALLPMLTTLLHRAHAGDGAMSLSGLGFAAVDGSGLMAALALPFALAAFAVVWLVSHVIHVLILISPWGGIDAALKSVRTALLAALAGVSMIEPWAGAFFSLLIIVVAWLLAGWSFRLMIFGTVFGWDFLTLRRKRFTPGVEFDRAFTARKIGKVPIRTYGRLQKDEQGLFKLIHRPWLVRAPRVLEIPAGSFAIGNGLFYPSFERVEGETSRALLSFPPRYASHEAALAKMYGISVRDVGLVKGFKAAWRWLKELFGFGSRAAAAPPAPA